MFCESCNRCIIPSAQRNSFAPKTFGVWLRETCNVTAEDGGVKHYILYGNPLCALSYALVGDTVEQKTAVPVFA
jgi:hypothetical protein